MGSDQTTITRFIVNSFVNFFKRRTGLPDDFSLVFSEKSGDAVVREDTDNPGTLNTAFANRIICEVTESFRQERPANYLPKGYSKKPIAEDKKIGLLLQQVYGTKKFTLGLKIRSHSEQTLRTWCNRMFMENTVSENVMVFDASYNWAIPTTFINFVKHVHGLIEANAGYGNTLDAYFDEIFSENVVDRYNRSGTVVTPSVNEIERSVVAVIDNSDFFSNIETTDGHYEVSFDVEFLMGIVTGFNLEFPMIVHNQFIDKEYRNGWMGANRVTRESTNMSVVGFTSPITERFIRYYRGDGGERVIEYDDFFPKNIYKYTRTILLTPIKVSSLDLRDVIDLKTLSEPKLPQRVKNYISKFPEDSKEYMKSPYLIELIQIGEKEEYFPFTMGSELVIRADIDMDLRKRYYLRISYVTDHTKLHGEVYPKILSTPETAIEALASIYPTLDSNVVIKQKEYDILVAAAEETSPAFKRMKTGINPLELLANIKVGK